MSLTRKQLDEMGIDLDNIEKIIKAHTEVTDALKKERDNYKAEAEKLADVQKKLDETEKKVTENEDFKKQFEELKSEISAKETAEKKSGAFRKLLKEKGYSDKGVEKIAKYGGYINSIELDENGSIKDSEKLVTAVEKDWDEYKPSETTTYATPSTPPKNTVTTDTKSEVTKYAEAYYNRLYGEKKES
ncbi:MAG: hypothetical protein K2K02_04710 [Ruminococcus sp.]|nr:hypothetical protein [Ruminococcus sp.]